ncbi:hypothetical protein B7463_g8016, partial [Scytalidium lignicola]
MSSHYSPNSPSSTWPLVPPRKPLPPSSNIHLGESPTTATASALSHPSIGYSTLPPDDSNLDTIFEHLNVSRSPTLSTTRSRRSISRTASPSVSAQNLGEDVESAACQPRPPNDAGSEEKLQPYYGPAFVPKKDAVSTYWIWEASACLVSLLYMAAIIGVLAYEDGKQLDQWGLLIAPNAVVSFLATIAKSSFLLAIEQILSQLKWLNFLRHSSPLTDLKLFDEVSRGPLGSIKLILSKHRKALLGTTAAVVLLLAGLIDPFVQLVFSFPSQPSIDQSVQATFPIANLYDPDSLILDQRGKNTDGKDSSTYADFKADEDDSYFHESFHASCSY